MNALSAARARRWLAATQRRCPYGDRRWQAHRAWLRLTGAAGRGKQQASVDLVLSRWPDAAVLVAAVDLGRDTAVRAAIGAFCIQRGLAPDDPVENAAVLVPIGRHVRHRALDPDGTLLASAYRGADRRSQDAWRERTGAAERGEAATDDPLAMVQVVLPARDLVLVSDRGGDVWLDAGTLTPVERPVDFPRIGWSPVAFSLDGTQVAVSRPTVVRVYDLPLRRVAGIAVRSLMEATPADLDVIGELGRRLRPSRVAAAVEVVRTGLAYRLGAEIVIGSGGAVTRSDDIALGER